MYRYVATYEKGNTIQVEGFEIPCVLPDMPPIDQMRNYGLPASEQVFRLEELPEWSGLQPHERKELSEWLWHQRRNGQWWLIAGEPQYIPGPFWMFLNFWDTEIGGLPVFRFSGLDFANVWNHVLLDEKCFGLLDMKPRRIGHTEIGLCFLYEITTRFRNSRMGLQNIIEDDAIAAYQRIVNANSKMHPAFKLTFKGSSDEPAGGLEFRMVKAANNEHKSIQHGGGITYRATKLKAFDGWRLRGYILDEWGKLWNPQMPIKEQWGIIRQCLALEMGTQIVGKAILPSTIEHVEGGKVLEVVNYFWENSDPRVLDADGQTVTGLYRYFADYTNLAPVDKFGRHQKAEFKKVWESKIAALQQKGLLDEIISYKRKFPSSPEDSMQEPASNAILHPGRLDLRRRQIEAYEATNSWPTLVDRPVRGDLTWVNNEFGGPVKFIPNTNGRFMVMQAPENPNARLWFGRSPAPANKAAYSGGIDPVDHIKTKDTNSKFAMSIFRHIDVTKEPEYVEVQMSDDAEILFANTELAKTGKFVCNYLYRPDDPKTAYADAYKALIWYGTDVVVEVDKPGFSNWMREVGADQYLAYKTQDMGVGATQSSTQGVKATSPLIGAYVDELKWFIYNYYESLSDLEQIRQFRNFVGDNQGKLDLLVASGLALMLHRQKLVTMNRMGGKSRTQGQHQITKRPARHPLEL